MNPECVFVNESAGPDQRYQLVFADKFPWALNQRYQNLKRPAAEPNRRLAFQQQPLRRQQTKGTKRSRLVCRRGGQISQIDLSSRPKTV